MSLKGRIKRLEDAIGIGAGCEECGYPVPSGKADRLFLAPVPDGYVRKGSDGSPEFVPVKEKEYRAEQLQFEGYQAQACGECGRFDGAPTLFVQLPPLPGAAQ